MLRRAALALTLALLVAAARAPQEAPTSGDNATRTPCAACCAPGGTCDAAFKGTPGVCCGVIADRPFCCPSSGSSFGAATCYRAGDAFRCRTASSPGRSVPSPRPVYVSNDRGTSWAWWLFFLVIPVLLLGLCFYSILAARNRAKEQPAMVAMTPQQLQAGPGGASYGYPVAGQPVYVPQGAAGGAASGTSPWMAGGAGLLGGYMLGSTLGGHHGGAYYPGGGSYYGGGGGDFAAGSDMGGGGFGGGGGDFAADS